MSQEFQTMVLSRARGFAREKHAGQVRKFTGLPYIVHPGNVASLIALAGLPEQFQAAAMLHDVVEDCYPTTIEGRVRARNELDLWFGQAITDLVFEVTDVSLPGDGNRATRKALDRDHLAKASGWGKSIKLADLIDNTQSITAHDPHFARTYMAEKAELLPLLKDGDGWLYGMAEALLVQWQEAQLQNALGGRRAG